MSVIHYNGVTLPYAFHTGFRQEVIYDDQGGTDWVCTKFDIEVQAVLNADYAALIYPALAGTTDNPAVFMKAVRTALLQPRKQFQVIFNGVDLIPANTAGLGSVDVMNGPQPQSCVITDLTNKTFLCTYRIVAHYWENNTVTPGGNPIVANAVGNNVLSNRWSESVELDQLNMSKRIREGKFIIRSDNRQALIADEVRRQMAIIGVPAGFVRDSATYTVDPSGLAIMYRIVDKEVFKNPPFPAFKAEGEYTESAPFMGPIRYLECRLRLEGPKDVSQASLISRAVAVVMSKVGTNAAILNPLNPKSTIPQHAVVRVGMYDNWVEALVRVMVPASKARTNNLAADFARMTYTPGSDPATTGGPSAPTPTFTDRGTAGLLLQAAAYYDPSILATQINRATGQFNTLTLEVGQAGVNQE